MRLSLSLLLLTCDAQLTLDQGTTLACRPAPCTRRVFSLPIPRGSAAAVYVTSDGGASLADVDAMAALLGEHVEVVEAGALIEAALRYAARGAEGGAAQ